MQPIDQLPRSQARALLGVCFDVDDTVTTGGVLDWEALAALHALHAAGLRLVAATGRPLGWAELFARTWPVDAAVGENGAGWCFRRDRALVWGYAQGPQERRAARQKLAAIEARVARELPHVRVSDDSWSRRCDLAFDVGERVALPASDVAKLVSVIEASGARAMVSSVHAHAAFGHYDKATGIEAAATDALGIQLAGEETRWLFVGDSGNDAAAFERFPLCAGVANVREHLSRLPAPPAYVARLPGGRGFAEIAQTVLKKRADGD